LESAILYERMFKRLLVLSNVFILGKEIVSNIDLQQLVDKFLSIASDGTDSDVAYFWFATRMNCLIFSDYRLPVPGKLLRRVPMRVIPT
ncbi:MAG TPA: hypothetical protein PLR50_04945, partial [Candidatus Rifleibacterium sp.]|nr:hypothetical protein [Candidatus Rifleibacterium sp.]